MIADDGKTPILMDFGSAMKARVPIENRSQALLQQVCRKFDTYFLINGPYRISLQNKVRWLTVLRNSSMSRLDKH